MSTHDVINNWDNIKRDTHNNRQDISNAYEYIHEARHGRVSAGGYKIVISDTMPEFE